MKKTKTLLVAMSMAMAAVVPVSPAFAADGPSICDFSPDSNFYSWFAWNFGYCS